jgi:hypothetical protein
VEKIAILTLEEFFSKRYKSQAMGLSASESPFHELSNDV